MSSDRSDNAYWAYSDSKDKFDYYMTGLAAAVFVYGVKNLVPQVLAFSPYGLRVLALVLILIAVILGLKRIESIVALKLWQHRRLYNQELSGALATAPGGGLLVNKATGDVLTVGHIAHELDRAKLELGALEDHIVREQNLAGALYHWRDRLLAAGFCALLAAQIWAGYSQ